MTPKHLLPQIWSPLIIDIGARISLSPYKDDFVSPIRPTRHAKIVAISPSFTGRVGDLSCSIDNDGEHFKTMKL